MVDLLRAPITLGLLLLSVGCQEEEAAAPQPPSIAAQWSADPEAARRSLLAEPDPVAQIAALRALASEHAEDLASLCGDLTGSPARECRQLSGRPHLWTPGKRVLGSLSVEGIADPWASHPAAASRCPDASCRIDDALDAAPEDGVGLCAGIQEAQWRDECFFRVGETAADRALGARICLGAGDYAARCLGHISRDAATPPLPLDDAEGWAARGETIEAAASALPAPLSGQLRDRMWAESLLRAYTAAAQATGDPLDHLPETATPHILAAAAWRLARDEDHSGLRAWQAALAATLERRGPGELSEERSAGVRQSWRQQLPGEEAIPWVTYLRDQRRARGKSPEAEAIICLLEANARRARPDHRLPEDALRHGDPQVRWTAARVLSDRSTSSRISSELVTDSDPLVRQRAERLQTR